MQTVEYENQYQKIHRIENIKQEVNTYLEYKLMYHTKMSYNKNTCMAINSNNLLIYANSKSIYILIILRFNNILSN